MPLKKTGRTGRRTSGVVAFRLPNEYIAQLDELAILEKRTRAHMAQTLIERALDQRAEDRRNDEPITVGGAYSVKS